MTGLYFERDQKFEIYGVEFSLTCSVSRKIKYTYYKPVLTEQYITHIASLQFYVILLTSLNRRAPIMGTGVETTVESHEEKIYQGRV